MPDDPVLTAIARLEARQERFEAGLARLEERQERFEIGLARLEERQERFEAGLARLEERQERFEIGLARLEERQERFEVRLVRLEERQERIEVAQLQLMTQLNTKLDDILDKISAIRQETDSIRGHVLYGLQENLILSQRITKIEDEIRKRS